MSTVKTIDELFQSIDMCVDEMKDKIKKLTRDYNQYIVRKSKKTIADATTVATKASQKTIAEIERQNDTICVTMLKTGKRCTKKRAEEGPDTELCKLHNNPKFATLERYDYGLSNLKNTESDDNNATGTTTPTVSDSVLNDNDDDSSSDGDFVQVKLTVDADGDTIDQEGNIWCLDKQYIIGKKDLRTKHKVYFKTV